MRISAAELETTVMKAAIGAGVVSGIAIEIGKAAVSLSDHGIDASAVIATALENLDRQDANRFRWSTTRAAAFSFQKPCIYLPSWLALRYATCSRLGRIKSSPRNLDVPILVVSLLAARHFDVNARHSADDQPTAACANGWFTIAENQISAWQHPGDIEFSRGFLEGSIDQVRTARAIEVDDELASDEHVCRSVFGIRIRNVTAARSWCRSHR